MRATRWVLPFLVVVLCCLGAAETQASDARLDALTVQPEYMEDYFNFRTFPTVAARYQNLVTASLGTRSGSDRSVGVIGAGDNTNYGVFAVYLNQVQVNGVEQGQFDVTWAKQFSGAAVGASILYQKSSANGPGLVKESPIGTLPTGQTGTNVLGLTGGVKIEMANNSMLEGALQLSWLGWELDADGDGVAETEDDGKISYKASGRLMTEVSNRSTLVPLVQFARMDLAEKVIAPTPEDKNQMTMLNLGVALHYEVNGSDLLVLGVSADYTSQEVGPTDALTFDESTWSLPTLFAALEFDVYSWLTVRAGATKTFHQTSNNLPGADTDVKDSDYRFGLGMGLHFDHFDVDASVDPDAVFTGGYLFSGEDSTPLTKVTATYYF